MRSSIVARRRMHNLGLTGHAQAAPEDIVRRLCAMQAQDYGPSKWSILQRAKGLAEADIDLALASGAIIRTHLLRPTWHFVARDDLRWLLALTGPRVRQMNRSRYQELGLDERTCARGEAVIAAALEGERELTRKEIGGVLDDAGIDRSGQRLPHILMHCELEAIICSGRLSGKQHTYALVDDRVPNDLRWDRDEALAEITRRYLVSHGPATVQDLRWWSSLTAADIKQALETLGSEVRSDSSDEMTFWSHATASGTPPPARGVHLLQRFDEFVVGYTKSRFFGDPHAEAARNAWSDRGGPRSVVIVDGMISGQWRRTLTNTSIQVDILLYNELERGDTRRLQSAAEALCDPRGRPVTIDMRSR